MTFSARLIESRLCLAEAENSSAGFDLHLCTNMHFDKIVPDKKRWRYELQNLKVVEAKGGFFHYTQYPIIRNGLIRNSAEFLGKFKKRALSMSNLRNASKNLRNGQCSDFQS